MATSWDLGEIRTSFFYRRNKHEIDQQVLWSAHALLMRVIAGNVKMAVTYLYFDIQHVLNLYFSLEYYL